jgi:hypothetical protein
MARQFFSNGSYVNDAETGKSFFAGGAYFNEGGSASGLSGTGALVGIATLTGTGDVGGNPRSWRVPSNAANATQATMIVFTDENMDTVEQVGDVTADASGNFDLLASNQGTALGTKRFAVVHQWDEDLETDEAFSSGAGIAEVVE